MEARNRNAWRSAHQRIYEFLRTNTNESPEPTLASLQPLYQAISHGCKAGRYEGAFRNIYVSRIAKSTLEDLTLSYSTQMLAGASTDLATLSQFFEKPFERTKSNFSAELTRGLIATVSTLLGTIGRITDAARAQSSLLREITKLKRSTEMYSYAAMVSGNHAHSVALLGNLTEAFAIARRGVTFANQASKYFEPFMVTYGNLAEIQFFTGKIEEARKTIDQIEAKSRIKGDAVKGKVAYLSVKAAISIYEKNWEEANVISQRIVSVANEVLYLRGIAAQTNARATLGAILERANTGLDQKKPDGLTPEAILFVENQFNDAISILRNAEHALFLAQGYICRANFRTTQGNWTLATIDLNEAEEIATVGPMRLLLADIAIQRARIALGQLFNFAPLSLAFKPEPGRAGLGDPTPITNEALKQISLASEIIEQTGYGLRAAEISEIRRACENMGRITVLSIRL